jgi:hypothetical protein
MTATATHLKEQPLSHRSQVSPKDPNTSLNETSLDLLGERTSTRDAV